MPSGAFSNFEFNLVDVDRLIENHYALSPTGQGKRGLGHINRSGVVMLCAAWELYIEQILLECAKKFTGSMDLPSQLPLYVQKSLSRFVKEAKHELKPLQLAGAGWKQVYHDHVIHKTDRFNTPTSANIDQLFKSLIGIDDMSQLWSVGVGPIDKFVSVRGDIAHRGRQAAYVRRWTLENYRERIRAVAVDTDNQTGQDMKNLLPTNRKPWRITK